MKELDIECVTPPYRRLPEEAADLVIVRDATVLAHEGYSICIVSRDVDMTVALHRLRENGTHVFHLPTMDPVRLTRDVVQFVRDARRQGVRVSEVVNHFARIFRDHDKSTSILADCVQFYDVLAFLRTLKDLIIDGDGKDAVANLKRV
jgi:hypothetical protein